jgi:hypothetical protein
MVAPGSSWVLDVGCGSSAVIRRFQDAGPKTRGIGYQTNLSSFLTGSNRFSRRAQRSRGTLNDSRTILMVANIRMRGVYHGR